MCVCVCVCVRVWISLYTAYSVCVCVCTRACKVPLDMHASLVLGLGGGRIGIQL